MKHSPFFYCIYHLAKLIYHTVYNVSVQGRENCPEGTFIIASNHRSYADPPLIAVTAGYGRYSFVAKEELFRNPAFGWLIRNLGAFPVSRGKGDTEVVDIAAEKLRDGGKLVIFPEGTRSKTGKVGKGKSGAAMIAAKSGCPVVPAGIVFEGKLHFRSKVTIKYGKPIYPGDFSLGTETPTRELKEIKRKIMGAITELVEGEENDGD